MTPAISFSHTINPASYSKETQSTTSSTSTRSLQTIQTTQSSKRSLAVLKNARCRKHKVWKKILSLMLTNQSRNAASLKICKHRLLNLRQQQNQLHVILRNTGIFALTMQQTADSRNFHISNLSSIRPNVSPVFAPKLTAHHFDPPHREQRTKANSSTQISLDHSKSLGAMGNMSLRSSTTIRISAGSASFQTSHQRLSETPSRTG